MMQLCATMRADRGLFLFLFYKNVIKTEAKTKYKNEANWWNISQTRRNHQFGPEKVRQHK